MFFVNISKLRSKMEKNEASYLVVRFLRKSGVVHLFHMIQSEYKMKKLRGGAKPDFCSFYQTNKEKFYKLMNLLEDDFSKDTLQAVIKYRCTLNIHCLDSVYIATQYFLKDILPPTEGEGFVDGGAYIGDTANVFFKAYIGGYHYSYYAWEPDKFNRKRLKNKLKNKNIEIIPYGMWSSKDSLRFCAAATAGSGISEEGDSMISVNSIDQVHKNHSITFIKMDIEGAEVEALKGAVNIIQTQKPKLAISIYHKPEYKLYIRHHSDNESDTVLYATV